MPLPSPNLDNRDFRQLVEEARLRIKQSCPQWTDLSPSDPGMVLLELFAHLTETMIYRLNRVPDKMYIEFLRLIGTRLQPPAAASVRLVFSRAKAEDQTLLIPRGTRVTLNRSGSTSDALIFTTATDETIAQGATQVEVLAHHCDLIEGELAGTGNGLPALVIKAQRPPIVAPTGDERDLVVGVEATAAELGERVPAITYTGKIYRVWREVENFTNVSDDPYVYVADRMSGMLLFAPAARLVQADGKLEDTPQALAAIPGVGRTIRLWYRRGGGTEGNVEANTLTQLKDAITGVQVTNPSPATGGHAAETLDNALVRGPQQLYALQRAVTARDFELLAYNSQAIARAKALTRAALWTYAAPGTVEVLLVPVLPEETPGNQVTMDVLKTHQTEDTRLRVQQVLDERRPLGTTCLVNWAHYKTVRAAARIVVRREEDAQAVMQRVLERLYQTINPLPTRFNSTGWRFGQALRASDIYDVALKEPGVRWVDQVQLMVDEVPQDNVATIAADTTQLHTWYVGSGSILFRSLNDGEGWESAGRFDGELITIVKGHPSRPGLIAVATSVPNNGGSRLHISWDCAETWDATPAKSVALQVQDLAWTLRGDAPLLLIATSTGLFELSMQPDGSLVQVLVERTNQALGFYAVVAITDVRGNINVAVASQNASGVYLSSTGGASNTFRQIGLREDIRKLAIQQDNARLFLWAGAASPGGDDPGKGCFTWELLGAENPQEGWQGFGKNWSGGTVRAIAFTATKVLVASHRTGVLQLDLQARTTPWQEPDVDCGLPQRDRGRFLPVLALATDPKEPEKQRVMAGGAKGTFRDIARSDDGKITYASSSRKEFSDRVTLPATWLFVSGEHEIKVMSEDEAN